MLLRSGRPDVLDKDSFKSPMIVAKGREEICRRCAGKRGEALGFL